MVAVSSSEHLFLRKRFEGTQARSYVADVDHHLMCFPPPPPSFVRAPPERPLVSERASVAEVVTCPNQRIETNIMECQVRNVHRCDAKTKVRLHLVFFYSSARLVYVCVRVCGCQDMSLCTRSCVLANLCPSTRGEQRVSTVTGNNGLWPDYGNKIKYKIRL